MTTAFIILLPLAAIAWAAGNAAIHKNYLYLEHAEIDEYLYQRGEWGRIKRNKKYAHRFWFIAMMALAGLFSILLHSNAEPGRELWNAAGAALYSIACFWGVFGWTAKWILNDTPFYLGSNWIDSRFKFKGGLLLMTIIQLACGVAGVWMLN